MRWPPVLRWAGIGALGGILTWAVVGVAATVLPLPAGTAGALGGVVLLALLASGVAEGLEEGKK